MFAGRDASRGLATFSLGGDAIKDEYDDLTDLNSQQMDSVREWEEQFTGEEIISGGGATPCSSILGLHIPKDPLKSHEI